MSPAVHFCRKLSSSQITNTELCRTSNSEIKFQFLIACCLILNNLHLHYRRKNDTVWETNRFIYQILSYSSGRWEFITRIHFHNWKQPHLMNVHNMSIEMKWWWQALVIMCTSWISSLSCRYLESFFPSR